MSRTIDLNDLLTRTDLAEMLGVTVPTIDAWSKTKPGFPAPVRTFGNMKVWDRADIERWQQRHCDTCTCNLGGGAS